MKIWLLLISLVLILQAQKLTLCGVCHKLVQQVQKHMLQTPFVASLQQISLAYCISARIQTRQVCKGAIRSMTKYIVNSIWLHISDPHAICPKIKACAQEYQKRDLQKDIDRILTNKTDKQWEQPTKQSILRVLHISDIHPDLFYTVGAPTKCSLPLCCRANIKQHINLNQVFNAVVSRQVLQVNSSGNQNNSAGYWGSLSNCDLPLQTFEVFLKQIKKMNIDFIIWTGDNTPHDIWAQTQSYNLNFTSMISQKLRQYTNATILPVMGNHQSWPVNVYDYQGTRQQVLNSGLALAWKPWLDQNAYDMLRTKGYYSMELQKFNNLKIISINTQAGNSQNWFLLRNPTDPGKMLDWIENQLRNSEAKNQKVWIIGHIPPNQNFNEWSMRYNALVERYSYIIRGQFFGHTHNDQIGIYHSLQKDEGVISYYLVAPSLTTYSYKNPQYRIMEVDYDTSQVIDYNQYTLNLSKYQKKDDKPQFEILYSFRDTYGVQNLHVKEGITVFAKNIQNDPQTQITYSKFMSGGMGQGHSGKEVYCSTMTTPQAKYNCNKTKKNYKKSTLQKVAGPWKDLIHKQ